MSCKSRRKITTYVTLMTIQLEALGLTSSHKLSYIPSHSVIRVDAGLGSEHLYRRIARHLPGSLPSLQQMDTRGYKSMQVDVSGSRKIHTTPIFTAKRSDDRISTLLDSTLYIRLTSRELECAMNFRVKLLLSKISSFILSIHCQGILSIVFRKR